MVTFALSQASIADPTPQSVSSKRAHMSSTSSSLSSPPSLSSSPSCAASPTLSPLGRPRAPPSPAGATRSLQPRAAAVVGQPRPASSTADRACHRAALLRPPCLPACAPMRLRASLRWCAAEASWRASRCRQPRPASSPRVSHNAGSGQGTASPAIQRPWSVHGSEGSSTTPACRASQR